MNQSRKRKRKSSCCDTSIKKFYRTESFACNIENLDKTEKQVVLAQKQENNNFISTIKLVKNHAFLSASDKAVSDFFMNTNSQFSHVNLINKDVFFQIFDEISLEGLDGITLEGLWKRLQQGLEFKLELNEFMRNLIWNMICQNEEINFFILKEDRPILNISEYNEYDNLDDNIEVCMKIGTASTSIYPYHLVKTDGIVGSCATFESRSDETEHIRSKCLDDVLKEYGNRLVIVASQRCRVRAIFNESTDSELAKELQPVEYCILEMVGRNRKLGAISAGPASLSTNFNLEGQTLFHHEKQLLFLHLIKKQAFSTKDYSTDQNRMGRLIHLSRFYKRFKSKQLILTEEIVNILRETENHRIDYASLKKHISNCKNIKKLIKAPEFKKFVSTNESLEYKDFYPNSSPNEWFSKNGSCRQVKIIELKDPTVNVVAYWNNFEEDIEYEDGNRLDNIGDININRELITDVYEFLAENTNKDISMLDIKNHFGLDLYTVRKAIRKLSQKQLIYIKAVDVGKQRIQIFSARYTSGNKKNKLTHNYVNKWREILERVIKKQIKSRAICLENLTGAKQIYNIFETEFMLDFKPFTLNYFQINRTTCSAAQKVCDIQPVLTFSKIKKKLRITFKENLYKKLIICNEYIPLRESDVNKMDAIVNLNYVFKVVNKVDVITKWILLRGMFGEIILNDENILLFLSGKTSKVNKRKLDANVMSNRTLPHNEQAISNMSNSNGYMDYKNFLEDYKTDISVDNLDIKKNALNFMGAYPKVVFLENVNGIKTEIIVSSQPKKYVYNASEYKTNNAVLTDRILSRLNIILKTVNEHKIIDDHTKMLRMVQDIETKLGYDIKIDRKSIYRLYRRLVEEGYIQIYKLIISDENKIKNHLFICLPTIKHNHSIIQSTIDQIRMRYFLADQRKNVIKVQPSQKSPFMSADILDSVQRLKELNKNYKDLKDCYYKLAGQLYGYSPKFLRLQIFHEFLFYMIYEHKNAMPLSEEEVEKVFQNYNIQLSSEDLKNMPPIYHKELNWKMFIPPLPQHKGWCQGWALVCDLLIRLPVSVFVRIHNVQFIVPELRDLLSHPIKRYLLLTEVSPTIRSPLLYKRLYISRISYILNQLAFMGLLQFGPQKFKEKDQMFIYLNRRATLLDTKTSEPGYHKTTEKEYPQIRYVFDSMIDVEKYWHNLFTIGRHTKLNMRNIMIGKTITILDASVNVDLQQTLKPKLSHEAVEFDNGEIPGDRRGAAGLDSSLWVHILKNWIKASKKNIEKTMLVGLKNDILNKATSIMPYEEIRKLSTFKNIPFPNKFTKNLKNRKKIPIHVKTNPPKNSRKKMVRKIKAKSHKVRSIKGKSSVMAHKVKVKVNWDSTEDKILLILKAIFIFLCQKSMSKQNISYYAIRDVLHLLYPKSRNKSDFAIKKRLKKLMSEHKYSKHVKHNFNNFLKFDIISKYFSQIVNGYMVKSENADNVLPKFSKSKLTIAFIYIAAFLKDHLKEVENLIFARATNADFIYLNKIEDLQIFEPEKAELLYENPMCEDDIKKDIVKSILYSSLNNEIVGSYELFHVYQHFNDTLIRKAVVEMRRHQMISIVKLNAKKERVQNAPPFQFSSNYLFSIVGTFSEATGEEAFNTINDLLLNGGYLNLNLSTSETISDPEARKRYGQLLTINELFTSISDIQFTIDIPEISVILNPDIKDYSALISELATRWQLKFERELKEKEVVKEQQEKGFSVSESECLNDGTDTTDKGNVIDIQFNSAKEINKLKNWMNHAIFGLPSTDDQEHFITKTIPTLDEIKEGMMQPYTPEEIRLIPHISDMINLLGRDEFPELNTDDKTLEEYKKHFIYVYPIVECIQISNMDLFKKSIPHTFFENLNEHFLNHLYGSTIVMEPKNDSLCNLIRENGGSHTDYDLALNIIDFVKSETILGVTAEKIRTKFPNEVGRMLTWKIVNILLELHILLKVGICDLVFIHYSYGKYWAVETQPISNVKLENINKNIFFLNPHLKTNNIKLIRIMPWNCVDGLININLFKKFLSLMFSYCIEHPKIPVKKIFSNYYYLKPVDIYYLLETLQNLACIQIKAYIPSETTIFSDWTYSEERAANVLDDFENQFVDPVLTSTMSLGISLNKF